MLCLTEEDIFEAVTYDQVMDAVEAALGLYETKEFEMPLRTHVQYQGNTLLVMPCFTKDSFGTKLVTLFPQNAPNELPPLFGVMVLNNARTGEPVALLNGATLTALRTGAVGGVSIRHLSPESASTVGIVGAGVQGFHQALYACVARNITDIYIFDLAAYQISYFIEKLAPEIPNVKLHQAASIDQLVEQSQIVITATTSSMPVLPNKEGLFDKKHFVGIGSYKPNMREFPQALFKRLRRVYIDTEHALAESGDLIEPLKQQWITRDQVRTLGRLLVENKANDIVKNETTLFKSVGMALFDVCVSQLIYQNALSKNLGQQITL